jgi:hypothetical protein
VTDAVAEAVAQVIRGGAEVRDPAAWHSRAAGRPASERANGLGSDAGSVRGTSGIAIRRYARPRHDRSGDRRASRCPVRSWDERQDVAGGGFFVGISKAALKAASVGVRHAVAVNLGRA